MEATLNSIIAAAAPLVIMTMGETITEKSGVVNLSLEGSLRLSAMTGFAVAFWFGHALPGFAAAAVVGALIAAIIATPRYMTTTPATARFRAATATPRPMIPEPT